MPHARGVVLRRGGKFMRAMLRNRTRSGQGLHRFSVTICLVAVLLVGLTFLVGYGHNLWVSLAVAGASAAVGGLLGFLFGIPRALTAPPAADAIADAAKYG